MKASVKLYNIHHFWGIFWVFCNFLTLGDLGGWNPPPLRFFRDFSNGPAGPRILGEFPKLYCWTFEKNPACVSFGILRYLRLLDRSFFKMRQNQQKSVKITENRQSKITYLIEITLEHWIMIKTLSNFVTWWVCTPYGLLKYTR